MTGFIQRMALSLGVLTCAAAFVPAAHAGCAGALAQKSSWTTSPDHRAGLIRAGYVNEMPAIVGLWRFEARLTGAQNGFPDGFLLDWGLATWHSDGTEIQFSGARTPAAGDVCMGVWQSLSPWKFYLNHIALGLTPPSPSGTFLGPISIRETVTVNRAGNSYSGKFTLTQYAGSPDSGTEFDESVPLATFTGTVTAKRVTTGN